MQTQKANTSTKHKYKYGFGGKLRREGEGGGRRLQEELEMGSNREAPAWGRSIFSDQCVLLQPPSPPQTSAFLTYTSELHRVYLGFAMQACPLDGSRWAAFLGRGGGRVEGRKGREEREAGGGREEWRDGRPGEEEGEARGGGGEEGRGGLLHSFSRDPATFFPLFFARGEGGA